MGERKKPADLELEGKIKIINAFRSNFRNFLDTEKPITITLLSIFFVPEMDQPTIANQPVNITYRGIDKELERVFERFMKSDSEPITIEETFRLVEFEGMSERLKAYVGKDIKRLTTDYELVSAPDVKEIIARETFYALLDKDLKEPIEEFWTAMRSREHYELPTRSSNEGTTLRHPLAKHHSKMTLVGARR